MNNANYHSNRRRSLHEGFTLIELMVVIVIIGLLAALVIPRFTRQADKAKVETARAQIVSFKNALELYKLDPNFGTYTTTSEGLQKLINNGVENFLDKENIPLDPWGNPYIYTCPGDQGRDFEIISYGADRSPGGTGFNADISSWE